MYDVEIVIDKIKHKDILEIKKLLSKSEIVVADNVTREVLEHIGKGVALKLVVDGEIAGVWCSLDIGEYTSLSYFYIREDIRCTVWVLKFFKTGFSYVDSSKPIIIVAKDTTGFDRYVEHLEGNSYVFKGFR